MLWIVSASSATLPESATITLHETVIARMNDHLIAQMPRAVVAIEGRPRRCVAVAMPAMIVLMAVVMPMIYALGEPELG